ncbi:ASPP [Drosophila busckii]|uniref:ASPP n=1 Tax=Drosophila busckii TaxID=30019 RepID=A0A0M4EVT5_DROBS|nr:apoptosis-stimulating of p53 protein 1 [Drosophila busckii]ALC42050.1 ASPP [Drosophila busckii]
MLTCVCRPVSGNLPKMPHASSILPNASRAAAFNASTRSGGGGGSGSGSGCDSNSSESQSPIHAVVTCEPKLNVPSRLTSAELRAMALRQQQQIDSQHQLLATKEQRLRFLKSQEVRSAVASAEGERLRRLRERVEAQETKLRRLRALRGQVDLQKTYNVTLSNDLDSIRALFSEKEKELSLAVAKVEALTRQLEELRRDRRCPVNLMAPGNGNSQTLPPQATRELEKLRRELMYRNQLSLQQDARLHMQREALQQRQAELRSVDQRIYELQTRLQRKKQANTHQQQQQQQQTAAAAAQQQQQQQQQLLKQGGVAALKQQLLQKQVNQLAAAAAAAAAGRAAERAIARGSVNVAAVEPFIHTPQKSNITSTANFLHANGNMLKHAASANTNQQNQLIQDLSHRQHHQTAAAAATAAATSSESDESKLAKKAKQAQTEAMDSTTHIYAEVGPKKREREAAAAAAAAAAEAAAATTTAAAAAATASKIPKSIASASNSNTAAALINKLNQQQQSTAAAAAKDEQHEIAVTSETLSERNTQQQLTVHSMPLGAVSKSVALAVANNKPLQLQLCNLAVPPRKPISSVAPTTVSGSASAIPKMITYSPKVNRVAPNVLTEARPALPPKPSKLSPTEAAAEPAAATSSSSSSSNNFALQINDNLPIKAKPLTIRKQPLFEQPPRLKATPAASKANSSLQQRKTVETPPQCKESTTPPQQHSPNSSSSSSQDEPDRISQPPAVDVSSSIKERTTASKPKLGRRVSFDPLALLLDASLEGELELVKKTAMQVANPSAANDEGITALHNAICAGHIDIVKFLVQYGCDVNAQDSDGWTPLHCAASCNNLSMVKFLVESGACLFASTLSDHETPAEKCEEDEEGFDGCSEYLYSIQEKLGILHNGDVYAVFAYEAQNNDELSFQVNEPLIVLRKGDDAENEWWWARSASGSEGYVPRNLLGLYPRVPPQSPQFSD